MAILKFAKWAIPITGILLLFTLFYPYLSVIISYLLKGYNLITIIVIFGFSSFLAIISILIAYPEPLGFSTPSKSVKNFFVRLCLFFLIIDLASFLSLFSFI